MSDSQGTQSEVSVGRRRVVVQRAGFTPPYNLEAERAVLAAILVSPQAILWAAEHLTPEHFWRHAHALVFTAMKTLHDHKSAIDFVTLNNQLTESGEIGTVGGVSYVASLADGVSRATNVPYYGGILSDLKMKRDALGVSDRIIAELVAGDKTGPELLTAIDGWALEAASGHVSSEVQLHASTALALANDIERRVANRGAISGVPTGIKILDDMTGGWQPGDLVIVAARPSMGKTSLASGLALHAAKEWQAKSAKEHVLFFSLEMSRQQLEFRHVSALSGIMLFRILRGYLGDIDLGRVGAAVNILATLPIAIDDTAKIGYVEIRAKSRRFKSEHGLGLLIVDYAQLTETSQAGKGRDYSNRNLELAAFSRNMKMLAKELNVPVIILSQLNRSSDGRSDKRPQLSDLRDSGALEQDADVVVMIHREDHAVEGKAELIIRKHRNGPTGVFEVEFSKEICLFSDAIVGTPEKKSSSPTTETRDGAQSLPGVETARPRRYAHARRPKM